MSGGLLGLEDNIEYKREVRVSGIRHRTTGCSAIVFYIGTCVAICFGLQANVLWSSNARVVLYSIVSLERSRNLYSL